VGGSEGDSIVSPPVPVRTAIQRSMASRAAYAALRASASEGGRSRGESGWETTRARLFGMSWCGREDLRFEDAATTWTRLLPRTQASSRS
jgi:hypothetical protein